MHRTQIILEDWQHQALRARAEQQGRSMSDIVRELVTEALKNPQAGLTLEDVAGIGEDAGAYGADHDAFLYGAGKKSG